MDMPMRCVGGVDKRPADPNWIFGHFHYEIDHVFRQNDHISSGRVAECACTCVLFDFVGAQREIAGEG